MAIKKVSNNTKEAIKQQSVLALPDRPSEKGYTPQQLKQYFTNLVLGDVSALTELDRVVDEINEKLGDIQDSSVMEYVQDQITAKFIEQAPMITISFEEGKLKYTKFGNTPIQQEIDITPEDSVFFDSENEYLNMKDGRIILPKTTIENIVGNIQDGMTVSEFLLDLKSKLNTLDENHKKDVQSIEKAIQDLLGGDLDDTLDSIKELADALKNNPSSIDDILSQITALNNNKVDKVAGMGLSTNDYDNTTKVFVDELKTKNVALKTDIKTNLSEMGQDSNYRTVTDDEKNTWNSKANAVHKHEISQVNGLQDALDGKSDTGHTHTLESLGAEASGTAEDLISSHNNSLFAHMRIQNSIDNLKKKVDGINNALSFETLAQLQDWLNGTYARPDGKKPSDLYVGQHLYIKDQDEQDYWVSETPVTMSNLSVLVTDKIDLNEYTLKSDLKRVAFTGDYGDLSNKPTIPSTLAELGQDDNHKTITQEKLTQIDTNKSNIDKKLNKTFGSSEANKMVVTDNDGNIVTAEAGSMAILVDNLESDSITMAPTANQVRILNNKKLENNLGSANAGKQLVVQDNGDVGLQAQKTKLSEFTNDSNFATLGQVEGLIDEIPTPDVSGQISTHNNDANAHPSIKAELNALSANINKKVDAVDGKGLSTNDFTNEEKTKLSKLENYNDSAITQEITNIKSTKEDKSVVSAINTRVETIETTLPKLATVDFVNSSVDTATATFIGTFESLSELKSAGTTKGANKNDYGFVYSADVTGNLLYTRYKYDGSTWLQEYVLNNNAFTSSQWNAINSGATTTNITQITRNLNNIADLQAEVAKKVEKVSGKGLSTNDYTTAEKEKLAGLNNYDDSGLISQIEDNASDIKSLQTHVANNQVPNTRKVNGKQLNKDITLIASDVGALPSDTTYVSSINGNSGAITNIATKDDLFSGSYTDLTNKPTLFSGSYTDLTNKPTIPTVNNGTLTIQKNGTSVGTFTANQSSNATANLTFGAAADKGVVTSIDTSASLPTSNAVKTYVDAEIDAIVGTGASTALDTIGEISKALQGNANIIDTLNQAIGAKANTSDLAKVATSGSYSDLSNKPTIPTNNNQLTNGAGYLTSSGTIANAVKATQDASGNVITSTYLPKTGGAISPTTGDTPLILNSATTNGAYLGLKRKDATYSTYIGINANDNPIIQTGGTSKQIATLDDIPSVPDIDGGLLEFMNDEYNKTLNKAQFIDGTYKLSVPSSNTSVTLSNAFNLTTLEAGTYYLSFTMTGGANAWSFTAINFWNGINKVFSRTFNASQTVSINTTKVFSYLLTLTSSITFNEISFTKSGGSSNTSYISKVIINSGSSAAPYQPYGGGDIAHLGDIHPIGTYIWTDGSYTPAERFGGTWEKIKDVFLLASGSSYSVGSKGGEATHTLTESEMPSHRHDMYYGSEFWVDVSGLGGQGFGHSPVWEKQESNPKNVTSHAGGSQPHNNMPPYLVANLWHRIA